MEDKFSIFLIWFIGVLVLYCYYLHKENKYKLHRFINEYSYQNNERTSVELTADLLRNNGIDVPYNVDSSQKLYEFLKDRDDNIRRRTK